MRVLCFLFLLVFAGAVAAFAYSNQEPATVRFLRDEWSVTSSFAVIAGVTYLLGMFSGWTIIGMIRRSANRVLEGVENRYPQPR
jgi:hypothetical protein